jgi:hypothetical protein
MRARIVTFAAFFMAAVTPVAAHRLDEYLQATFVAVEKDRARLDMYLTPGANVLPSVLADIDTDADGVISETEQRTYAVRVLVDLSITLNDTRLSPRFISVEFPALAQMKEGLGEIHLEFTVDLPRSGTNRSLRLANRHHSQIAVYQVNSLVSRDPDIRIGSLRRDSTQSIFELEYTQVDRSARSTQLPANHADPRG